MSECALPAARVTRGARYPRRTVCASRIAHRARRDWRAWRDASDNGERTQRKPEQVEASRESWIE